MTTIVCCFCFLNSFLGYVCSLTAVNRSWYPVVTSWSFCFLQLEVSQLEGSLQQPKAQSSMSPYLVPDTAALCQHLNLIRQLAKSGCFIIIIPRTGFYCCSSSFLPPTMWNKCVWGGLQDLQLYLESPSASCTDANFTRLFTEVVPLVL